MLKSRKQFNLPEEFRDKFLETIMPGIIPRDTFIDWYNIFSKIDKFKNNFGLFDELANKNDIAIKDILRDCFLSSDNPQELITTCFQLLGHTGDNYVSRQDEIIFKKIKAVTEKKADDFASLFVELGIKNIILENINDYFLGVQIGLECNRRKNMGGKMFHSFLTPILKKIADELSITLKVEEKLFYKNSTMSKKVDFCFEKNNKRLGVEVNFYTVSGSKPTEIKRSYGEVNRKLKDTNIGLIWITDGFGYKSMKKSLKEAFEIHPNIYNVKMLQQDLKNDLIDFYNL